MDVVVFHHFSQFYDFKKRSSSLSILEKSIATVKIFLFEINCWLFMSSIYMKFVLRSVKNLHSESMLNNLFSFETSRNTRRSSLSLINEQCWKQKRQRQSIIYRATNLFNTLRTNNILLGNILALRCKKIYHEIRTSYIE